MDNTIDVVEMPSLKGGLGWAPGEFLVKTLGDQQTDKFLREHGPWLALGVVLVLGIGVGLWAWGR